MTAPGGSVVWIIGRPASGKSTLAQGLRDELRARGGAVLWLDSDDLRAVLTPKPTYSDAERDWFYGAIAQIAERAAAGGVHVLISATAPLRTYRERLRGRVARFAEIYVRCSEAELKRRDPKGLYRQADLGAVTNLPGYHAPFEEPSGAELVLDSETMPAAAMLEKTLRVLEPVWAA
jgi:adenylylsulfate kinase